MAFAVQILPADDSTVRVFIFGGQSNMVGSDSKAKDIANFPRYVGLDQPQPKVLFNYCLGRETKNRSEGWVKLQPVNNIVGPELSFARKVTGNIKSPIAIIKVAAGGTHLGGDWNPDEPSGFKMYPLAMKVIRESLAKLEEKGLEYKIEAVMWHQGENDMFNEDYRKNYGRNLKNFLACWRRDLKMPQLPFFIGELCTKTIWGMDLRPRMYDISLGQKAVTEDDPLATFVRTSHVGVEIGRPVGLHYHYGTLGQLQHGENYADAYLKSIDKHVAETKKPLKVWPIQRGQKVRLFLFAGHRNMEGERAFVQELKELPGGKTWAQDNPKIPFKYSLGGGFKVSNGWEPLGLTQYYDTFGPELSFAARLDKLENQNFAIAKFTHSGSQIIDWTPEGSMAKSRMLYKRFIEFARTSIRELQERGNQVELSILYHVGENDMSFYPYRKDAPKRIESMIEASRKDLGLPHLKWFVSQQSPTDEKGLNRVDVVNEVAKVLKDDPHAIHIKVDNLPEQKKILVIDTPGIIKLGQILADAVAAKSQQ